MSLRRDAEANRVRILEAAREAFAERGLAVTLDEIARRAGVGVGTVYRRFPDKDALIDALFDTSLDEIVALADHALEDDSAWDGLVGFLVSLLALQARDRGLREIVNGEGRGQARVAAARARIKPRVETLITRAKAEGALREDLAPTDFPLLLFMLEAVLDTTRDAAPETWRRALGLLLDGLVTAREAPSRLSTPPLDDAALEAAMHCKRR